jgi:hypothetical protein
MSYFQKHNTKNSLLKKFFTTAQNIIPYRSEMFMSEHVALYAMIKQENYQLYQPQEGSSTVSVQNSRNFEEKFNDNG